MLELWIFFSSAMLTYKNIITGRFRYSFLLTVVHYILQVDLTDGDGRTALRAAAWGGHEEVVNSLLRAGASPSLPDNEGRTPLIAAAYMGHADIVDKLLNSGADVNHSDSDGRYVVC